MKLKHSTKMSQLYPLVFLISIGLSDTQACGGRSLQGKQEEQSTSQAQQQAKTTPGTVLDYYLMLPDKYVRFARNENRRSIIKVKDIENGYLRLEGDWDGWAEIALFRKSDKSAIIAVEEIGCGPICGCVSIQFLHYGDGNWKDVTRSVLPKVPEKVLRSEYRRLSGEADRYTPPYYYDLPRTGTDVQVMIQFPAKNDGRYSIDERPVFRLRWNGEKFELQKIK